MTIETFAGTLPAITPACMTPEELALWWQANRLINPNRRGSVPCIDCPLAFAEEMRRQDCCNGIPGGGLHGRRPKYRTALERREAKCRSDVAFRRRRREAAIA